MQNVLRHHVIPHHVGLTANVLLILTGLLHVHVKPDILAHLLRVDQNA